MRTGRGLTRVRGGAPRPLGAGGGAVDLMIELMSCYLFLPSSAPLVAFGTGNGRWSMWTQQQATTSLRAVVAFDFGNQLVPTHLASNIPFGSFQCSLERGYDTP